MNLIILWLIFSFWLVLALGRAARRTISISTPAVLFICFCGVVLGARGGQPAPRASISLLVAIALVESGNNPNAIGDGGRATGAWQMHAAARTDARKLLVAVRAPADAELAAALLQNLNLRLTVALTRPPTPAESYAAWNLGFQGFKARGFSLARCPQITQRAAARVEHLLKAGQ